MKKQNMFQIALLAMALFMSMAAMAQSKIYYVSPTGTGDGSSWTNATTLTDALGKAVAGDQIWVQGFEQIDAANKLYIVPAGSETTGFTLKSGVQLYGGFKGDEATIDGRETLGKPYQLKYRSVLSGDIGKNDAVDNTNLIFPANSTRTDNATHVLTLNMAPSSGGNNNTYPTVVNGFSIGGGQADGTDEKGGGIYIYGDNTGGGIFRIERCFFVNNYATQGGAIYVADKVQNQNNNYSLVNQCAVYNNAAGARGAIVNAGGGIYLAGAATVVNSTIFNNENGGIRLSTGSKVINSTVARNTGAGIDMIETVTDFSVFNSIVWGNTLLSAENQPKFQNSAYHEVTVTNTDAGTDGNHNVYVTKENQGDKDAPMFDAPSVKTSFDRDFNWRQMAYPLWSWNVLEGSVMHDQGNDGAYQTTTYGDQDMGGNPRVDGTIDIGAYEFQKIPTGRIRYVKAGGTGDGSSWANASGDLQKMIDELALNNPQNLAGEVWVAEGIYQPIGWIDNDKNYTAAFRMRDGISVYGGFAGTETSKNDRLMAGNMPWQYSKVTILKGASYQDDAQWNTTDTKWNVSSSASRHVVWFAPYPYQENGSFTKSTILDGFTIVGGHAQGDAGISDFRTDCGGGVFMGVNSYLYNCVVKECSAVSDGGGVYTEGGRIMGSLIYNSSADDNGGGVFVDNAGIVLQSMVTNCAATNGGGIYLNRDALWDGKEHPEYLILSTSIVSNNTNKANGAVYCNDGGVILQTTITQNATIRSTDLADRNAARTGGLYINKYALVINSVLWNNQLMGSAAAQMYALNPTQEKVRFYNAAISNFNTSVWNNILQTEILQLADQNEAGGTDTEGFISPNFTTDKMPNETGVQAALKEVEYFWKPITGSNLRARGRTLGTFPEEVLVAPELDINGELFQQKPSIGSYCIEAGQITPEVRDGRQTLRVYIDADCTVPDHNGNSWATAYRSLNETLDYFAKLQGTVQIGGQTVTISEDTRFEIYVLEGNLWPRYAYTNLDPKTATIDIQASVSGATYYIYGGFRRDETNQNNAQHAPLTYRSIINGNIEGKVQEEGIYHCITVAKGAKVLLDGFHVINGYAAGEATRQYGAGLLVHDGAEATVNNCIFENNTAKEGAAIDARNAKLKMNNCVVNNNTNITETSAVINCPNLTMNHVTVVNNVGAAPANMGTSSFSVGNTSGNTIENLASIGEAGAVNFANPTNGQGATLGFDTYLGGYSEFRPLTSSTEAAVLINKATGTSAENTKDITTINSRNLGGAPDRGAYEAILPESGVIYVRDTDGDDNSDGSSWENAYKTLTKALDVAQSGDKIWVAEGTYTGNIKGNPNNVNDNANIHSQPYAYKMKEGVNVYGGFPDSGTPGEDDRDPNLNETILQAQISSTEFPTVEGDGPLTVGRVVVQPNHFNTETVWDGFTIRNGYLNTHFRFAISGNFLNVQTGLFYNNGTQKGIGHVAGAGAFLMGNGVLENCRIEDNHILAWDRNQINSGGGTHGAGAGVYSIGGVLRNCQVLNNVLKVYSNQSPYSGATVGSAFAYGAGIYMLNDGNYKAAVYNSIVADNTLEARVWQGTGAADGGTAAYHTIAIGAGICQVSGDFYNNTIVGNKAYTDNAPRANIICGGLMLYEGAKIYNCIIYNNTGETKRPNNNDGRFGLAQYMNEQLVCLKIKNQGFQGWIDPQDGSTGAADDLGNNGYNLEKASIDIRYSNVGRLNENNQPEKSTFLEYTEGDNQVTYESRHNTHLYPKFVAESGGNYRLDAGSPAINTGTEAIPGVTIPDYDAEYTARIKDCSIDMGAFESTNESNISYTTQTENEQTIGIYYVSQYGAGLRSGKNPANAACAMKLQDILTAAGAAVKVGTLTSAIVKVAGYENAAYVYHANTLASASDPQSYTYVVPKGVTLMGGYYEGTYSNGSYNHDGWDDVTTGDNIRNPMKFQTVLSAISEANASTVQTVRGYHAVTFGAWPGTAALAEETIIDGLWLIDGSATSMAGTGNPNTRGGGAIVPSGAHVRNCVVMNCEAIQGGGLYLLPGAMVSGTLVQYNTADQGGGIFADNTGAGADARAHMVSCTVTDNEATEVGGGIFQMEGALMAINSVVWGNTAPSDRNVSSVVTKKYADNKLLAMVKTMNPAQTDNEYYPYNYCFVETFEMPTTFENTSMTGEGDIYFEDERRLLKVYSPLIKRGMPTKYAEYWETQRVADRDMRNVLRAQTDYTRADVGAYAYEGGSLPTEQLITRIFVSKGTNLQLQDGTPMENYLGRSFYTSLNHLDDALEYINRVRDAGTGDADDNTVFEILLGPGIYKPSVRRQDAATTTLDQRQNSFDIPVNVKIYGGFSGEEKISTKITSIPASTGDIEMTPGGDLPTILNARSFSDMNGNNVYEPWELEHQSILSGELDVSTTAKNVYHVVYSDTRETNATTKQVTLDGVTIMGGETSHVLSDDTNDIGRGGGIYTNGVDYTLHRCRLIDNKAVRGGGLYARDARATLIGCVVAGNGPVDSYTGAKEMRGGGIYASSESTEAFIYAVNSLFANNETNGQGGAIAVGSSSSYVDLMNCNIVRNKAQSHSALYDAGNTNTDNKNKITNCVIWGNEDNDNTLAVINGNAAITYSASEWLATDGNAHNIRLNSENMAIDGPRFKTPSSVAGVTGNSYASQWNPASVSVLADVGNGTKNFSTNIEDGAYKDWFDNNAPTFQGQYIQDRERYMAPLDDNGNTPDVRIIDIGLFEYPHPNDLSKLDAVYVATEDAGLANGTSWANAISNLKQAIIALANPTGNHGTTEKKIYVRNGTYSMAQLSHNNVAFPLYMSSENSYGTSLEIIGACTGVGHTQDFSNPTLLTNSPLSRNTTHILLDINTGTKPVTVSGFTFANTSQGVNSDNTTGGKGVNLMNIGPGGKVTLKNVAFRNNYGYGVSTVTNDGELLLVNALFADGAYTEGSTGVGLQAKGTTTVVNATFAQNRTDIDIDATDDSNLSVYNSTSWNNDTQYLSTDDINANVSFASDIQNNDVQNGPNFVDPDHTDVLSRDYNIRPSMNLLNQGVNDLYTQHALGNASGTAIPATETDLGNHIRLTGATIDIGAYEYNAQLQPIIYVKPVVGGTGDGSSWTNATRDFQGAVDLASVYSANNGNATGYVFVHNSQPMNNTLRVSMPGAKVYGGMNDELTDKTTTEEQVADLLGKRQGMLQANQHSKIAGGIQITAASLVDGFEITGNATVSGGGMLSTSIVNGAVTGGTSQDGLLYNSLVLGDVSGVKAVNVTATGTITEAADIGNNRQKVTETNSYVTDDYWKYQLMETSADIDAGTITDLKTYTDLVGHKRDLIGNARIRNTVDKGCFETWNISSDYAITATDYPVGKSVVYVRKNQELKIQNANDGTLVYPNGSAFNPGFLLLEHQAGLRGNGNFISLTNLAMERNVPASGSDLANIPFTVSKKEEGTTNAISYQIYDGATRAGYDYKFESSGGEAWEALTAVTGNQALALNNGGTDEVKVRFYGNEYKEEGTDKSISLNKYNFNELWTSETTGGNRFTHKENMGWNLFGSPYLCAMNYSDMEYGRVLYGYNNGYQTVKTYNSNDGITVEGHIPAGSAVFTQTATLKDAETFAVKQPAGEKSGDAIDRMAPLRIALYAAGTTRSTRGTGDLTDETPQFVDELQLEAVDPEMARNDFDPGADGVKWMAPDSLPQIYAERGGGRYALLSAVSRSGEVAVSLNVPAIGTYTFALPEDCDASDYEAVLLKDSRTGRTADLLQAPYEFLADEAGTLAGRFTVSFTLADAAADGTAIRVQAEGRGRAQLIGLQAGDRIRVYDPNGQLHAEAVAGGPTASFRLQPGIFFFNVDRGGRETTVKAVVR